MNKIRDINSFAYRLRNARRRNGITQSALAMEIGCTQTTVSLWEKGIHRPWGKSEHIKLLSAVLRTTPEYLLNGGEAIG